MGELDPLLLGSVGFLLTTLFFIIARIIKLHYDEKRAHQRTEAILAMAANDHRQQKHENEPIVVGGRRRVGARRRQVRDDDNDEYLGFINTAMDNENYSNEEGDGEVIGNKIESDEHIGKKKLAKLQAKAERKAQREAELAEREEKKQREAEKEKKLEEKRQEEQLQEEAEKERKRLEQEEKEKKEEEEYQKMKLEFKVDDEGFDQLEDDESKNLMRDFIEYIKDAKVVNMDELAAYFNLKVEEAVERLKYFIDDGQLTGVMDDRGKFIYITNEELQAVAKFINQRGRVSLTELAEYSNKLISLKTL